ncbi:hypothetical protein ABT346_20055 [Micromonospora peucetia]|uniref:hypothetical protein n=1 Tax=Micromonospora peucetia TaxID=47871 RepID=UPI003331F842
MHYIRDVENFLIPHLGQLILGDLNTRQLTVAFAQIAATRNRHGQPQTLHRIHWHLNCWPATAYRDASVVSLVEVHDVNRQRALVGPIAHLAA